MAIAGASAVSTAWGSDLQDACVAGTEAHHPEISNVDTACACIEENADQSAIDEILAATGPGDFTEPTKEIMRACGYDI